MADAVEGSVRQSLSPISVETTRPIIETLPDQVIELGKQLPVQIRKRFVSMMEMWTVDQLLFLTIRIHVLSIMLSPGIIGLILQFLTVTLMACTIARERETGTT